MIRKGQASAPLAAEAFGARWRGRFADPAFDAQRDAIDAIAAVAYQTYDEGRKAPRLAGLVREVLEGERVEVELLDLSRTMSDPHRHIHPCKGCVSTAMPLQGGRAGRQSVLVRAGWR